MKLFDISLLALFSAALATSMPRSLQNDFKDFTSLTCKYKDDPEVQLAINYLRSKQWAGLVAEVLEKEVQELPKQCLHRH